MACHYHPDRESTDVCAICGKSICKECGLEIAGKVYCKECLEKIVGIGIDNTEQEAEPVQQEPIETEPVSEVDEYINENIYQPQEEQAAESAHLEETIYAQEPEYVPENKIISDDSPYNIKENINYSGGLESSYLQENEIPQQVTQNEIDKYAEEILQQQVNEPQEDFIYPDHSYDPEPTSARQELEDKYEKYLDDLYFDENEVPLGEQLAKDEEQYGSLTRRPYQPQPEETLLEKPSVEITPQRRETPEEMEARIRAEMAPKPQTPPKNETPEEMEARIRAEIAREMQGGKSGDGNIHNLNYKDEKEPMGVVDVLLTIVLIIVILIVIYYLIYLFMLSTYYPTFMDALYALTNPQNVINNIISH